MQLPFTLTPTAASRVSSTVETTALPASWVSLGGASQTYYQGLEAGFKLAVPPGHFFVRLDIENSALEYLKDNQGYDLLQLEEQMKIWNQQQLKTRIEPYEYSYDKLETDGSIYYGSNGEAVTFKVACRATPTSGATQVFGRAKIAYSTFDESEIQIDRYTIPYEEEQEEIQLIVDSHILRYERSSITHEIGGKAFRIYHLETDGLTAFVAASALFDGDEIISPGPDEINEVRGIYNLYLPEDFQGNELTIGVMFANLYHYQNTVDFEISMEGIMK
jgi:hypothetical protein